MKNLCKFLFFYLELDMFLLNEDEAIMKYCSENPSFQKEDYTGFDAYYTISNKQQHLKGFLHKKEGVWSIGVYGISEGAFSSPVSSLRQIKHFVKKHCV